MTRENGLLDHTEQKADGNAFPSAWCITADANMYGYLQTKDDKVELQLKRQSRTEVTEARSVIWLVLVCRTERSDDSNGR